MTQAFYFCHQKWVDHVALRSLSSGTNHFEEKPTVLCQINPKILELDNLSIVFILDAKEMPLCTTLFRKGSLVLTAAITAFGVIEMPSVCLIERFKILSAIPRTKTLDFSNLHMTLS